MSAKKTPAVRALENARAAFELLEYEYDPDAGEIGLHAAQALGRPASSVFKTLVAALDDGELVCAVIPSDARLNLKALPDRKDRSVRHFPPSPEPAPT